MREIKFRAWFGPPHYSEPHMAYLDANDDFGGASATWQLRYLQHPEEDGPIYMQYTGLRDKNGVEIYEGDILQRPSTINKEFHGDWIRDEVTYKPGVFFVSHVASEKGRLPRGYTAGELLNNYFDYDGKLFAFATDYMPECEGEVIGNIYENPELLEQSL